MFSFKSQGYLFFEDFPGYFVGLVFVIITLLIIPYLFHIELIFQYFS